MGGESSLCCAKKKNDGTSPPWMMLEFIGPEHMNYGGRNSKDRKVTKSSAAACPPMPSMRPSRQSVIDMTDENVESHSPYPFQ